ncbi:hypothetical protein GUITHDRAFT_132422 [Guillardia theta CCMP2712]|uniref:Uncharacterized protein n=2 Tax=Guillardia theta TaxID=55529 RepID=L1K0U8_GUITC|nr:hypothetical protein GUITHDRAFT_132422 [Guillardia theta CCMP2712]EKX53993.1 hypothetical protein GUITHDRAFT_132422 [Guillardia theta CCMP2712]|eukprot:XP_005840973.1 hypothetical protein GUITHDRAFT_132422 [Guillardia theta CCMP2712]
MVKVAGEDGEGGAGGRDAGGREDHRTGSRHDADEEKRQVDQAADIVRGSDAGMSAWEKDKVDELQTVIFELKNGKTKSGIPIIDPQLLAISSVVGRLLVLQLKSPRIDDGLSVAMDRRIEEAVKERIDSSNESLSAIGVIAALILSITAPFCFNAIQQSDIIKGEDAYKIFLHESDLERLQYTLASLLILSALCSGLSVISSLAMYVHLNNVMPDANSKLWFLRHAWMVFPEKLLVAAVFCLCPAAPLGMILCYGDTMGLISLVLFGALVPPYLCWQLYMQISCRRHVAPRFVVIGNR